MGLKFGLLRNVRVHHRLGVFENRMFSRIFGPVKREMTGGWENCSVKIQAWVDLY
jgi:hypothetical protein